MSLFKYWRAHPPLHILVQGIASGLAGRPVGEVADEAREPKKHIESAEELFGILQSAGIPVGVIQQ